MKYCSNCGNLIRFDVPPLDDRARFICDHCDIIHYENPRVIVGTIPLWVNEAGTTEVLLCKRAIQPRLGYWTLPAGYMENGESVEQGASRETVEEAGTVLENLQLYAIYSVPRVSQVFLFFLGRIPEPVFDPNFETQEARLFPLSDIPWEDLSFRSVTFALEHLVKEADPWGRAIIHTASAE